MATLDIKIADLPAVQAIIKELADENDRLRELLRQADPSGEGRLALWGTRPGGDRGSDPDDDPFRRNEGDTADEAGSYEWRCSACGAVAFRTPLMTHPAADESESR